MFSIFVKNLNLSIIALCLVSGLFAIDFNNPQNIVGSFDPSLYLKPDSSKGYTLSHQLNKSGSFKYTWYLDNKTKRVTIEISSIGGLFVDLNGVSKLIDSKSWSTKRQVYEFTEEVSKIELEIIFLSGYSAQVQSIEIDQPTHGFDANYSYKKLDYSYQKGFEPSSKTSNAPFGVNLEAEYIFDELTYLQQKKLLAQLKNDGFNSIRLHKTYRVYQRRGFSLIDKLQRFLNLCDHLNLIVYLDIISYPKVSQGVDGWKQSIFLNEELQSKAVEWINILSTIKINGGSLFRWPQLAYICLANENSLYFEESKNSLDVFNRKLLDRRMVKWISRNDFKEELMNSFYSKFVNLLKKKGFKKQIFLSNYQLGGDDLRVNQLLSKEVDRHLYLDYPIFYKGLVKVKNNNPMEHLKKLKKHYLEISPVYGTYLSEFNLPWPNRFQHTLIPLLFYLNHFRPIKGVWFYDYRLRSKKFHSGGIFGVQKFKSIIGQIPFWRSLSTLDYKVKAQENSLELQFRDYSVFVGNTFVKNTEVHYTVWKNCINSETRLFSFEKGHLDAFDSMGQIQIKSGGVHSEIALPSKVNTELLQKVQCG